MRSDLPDLEVALGQADLLFRTLFEQSGVGIAFLDSDRRVIKANQKFCDLLSYHTTDLPLPLPDLIHPEDWQLLCIGLHTLDSGIQSNFSLEKRYICKNGVFLWANTTVARVGEVSSAPQLYTLMVQDISTCKQTEAAYQQRESQLSSILNCTNAAIARLRRLSDQEFEYDYMSAGCQQVFGFSAEEFLADKHLWRSHVFPDDLAKLLLPEQVTQPRVLTAEYRFYHKDGNLRWIAGFVTAEWDAASNSWVLTAIDVDITERKRTEAELREKEAFLRSIYEGVRTSIFVVDITADGDFHYAGFNPVHVKMTGITNEALRGKTPEQVLPPTTAAEVRRNYQRCVEEGGILFEERLSFQGQDLWWQTRLTPLQDEQGRIYRIVGTSNNITKRKQAQMALQASQERLNFLLTSSPAVIYTAKPESPYTATFVSQNIETLTGYKVEQFYQESGFWLQCLHPDDVSVVHQAITQLIKNGHVSYEYRFLHPSGNYCWLQDEAKLIRDAAGAPVEIIGYCIDITSRKTAELALQQLNTELEQRIQSRTAALQESEELFRQFTENIPKVFWMEDLEGNLLYVSPSFAEVWGIPTATLYQNPKAWLDAVHPEDRIWMAIVAINRLEYHEEDIEYRILQSDTDICWIRERAFPIYNSQGAAYRVARIAEDITAQKQAEAEIHRSRDLFEAVFQESADAVFLVDPVTLLILNCNQRAVDLFEANHTDELIGIQGHTLHRHPFWGNDVLVAQQQLAANGVWSGEIEYCTLRGHFFWGSIAAKTIHIAGRKMTLVRVSDISQRKQSEQLLQQQANREALLRQVAFRTRESLNLNYILTTSVNQVQAFLQTDRVLIFQFEPEGSGYIAVEAVSDPQFSILGAHFHDPCFSMQVAERYQQGHTSAISDIYSADLTPCYVDFLAQSQVRANLVVPILQDQQLWGLLLAHHCTAPRHWQPFELDLLTQFADQVGIAIRQTNLYDTLKTQLSERRRAEQALAQQVQYEQLLQTISQQIRSSLRLEEILAAAVTQVQQVLQVDRALVFRLYANGTGCVIKEATLPQYPITAEMRFPEEQFPLECRTLYQRGQARAITNVDNDILADCLVKFMHQIQVKSKLVVPIVQSDEETGSTVWGLLILHSCAVYRQWQPAEVELMQKVAVQMGIAIQQSELYVQLETQLKQKEILIKEIHHRVKNNLQVISAMLKLQARATQDTAVLDVLEDSRNRLRAIGLIHEILYRSNDLEQLNFDEYIQKLANTILATHSSANQVRLVYQLQPVCLNLDTAIPCGLLLNELITNAIKHAFPNGRRGEIWVGLEAVGNTYPPMPSLHTYPPAERDEMIASQSQSHYILSVHDNGIGMSADFDLNHLQSLGLKIAYDLALQLQGTLTLERTQGTRFQLIFSELKYRKRL